MNKLFKTMLYALLVLSFCSCHQAEEKVKYYPNGQIEEICTYRNGKMDGKLVVYYETGVLYGEGRMSKNRFVGEWRTYYPDGRIMTIEKYNRRGKLKTFDSWDQKGNHVIVDGTGTLVTYYPNGSIKQMATYKDCHFDGSNEGWYPNGQKEHEFFYKEGKPTGIWHFWNEDGTLYQTENHME